MPVVRPRRRAVAVAVLVLIAGGLGVGRVLLRPSHREREQPAPPPSGSAEAGAVVLYDSGALAGPPRGSSWPPPDMSLAWLSILEEEVGATRAVDVSDPAAAGLDLAGTSIVAVTHACGPRADRLAPTLDAAAHAGALIVLEQPSTTLAGAFGFEMATTDRPAARVTAVESVLGYAPDDWYRALPPPALRCECGRWPAEARPLLWLDDAPAAWLTPRGEGAVLLLACDVGRWVAGLRQGAVRRRAPDGSLERARRQEPCPGSALLVADPQRTDAWTPRSDLLVRSLLDAGFAQAPAARLSPLPAGAAGLLLLAFDENGCGDRAQFLGELAARAGVSGTYFIVPARMTAAGMARALAAGCELQLRWTRQPGQLPQGWLGGLRRSQPAFPPAASLSDQLAALQRRLPANAPPIVACRTAPCCFDADDPARALRLLEAQGLQLDTSFGPAAEAIGYVFETGRPFHPLDANGYPFRLLELPFPCRDDERYDPQLQRRLFEDSAAGFRCVLAPVFHADTMDRNPAPGRMHGLLEVFDMAVRHRHPVSSAGGYLQFRRDRLAGRVARLPGRAQAAPISTAPSRAVWRRFQVDVVGVRQAVEVPARHASGVLLQRLVIDGFALPAPAAEPCGWVQLPLPAGRHTLEAEYTAGGRP